MRLIALSVAALGVAQIVSWGTLFYAIAILAAPMSRTIGASEEAVFFAFTLALAVSALAAPAAGRAIDRYGGGAVMMLGSVLAAVAFAVLSVAGGIASFIVGWALAGAAMSATLYDAAFASLHRRWPAHYRGAVTALSLIGGLASTVAWPATFALEQKLGLPRTLASFAALHLLVTLPIHALFRGSAADRVRTPDAASAIGPDLARRFAWLSAAFAIATFVLTAITAHLAAILAPRGYSMETVVRAGMLFGPAQVAARALEWVVGRDAPALRSTLVAFALLVAATASVFFLDGELAPALAFALLLGGASGLVTIARGTAPAALAEGAPIGEVLGRIARVSLVARAIAPFAFVSLLDPRLPGAAAPLALVALALVATGSYRLAIRGA